jgi:hypothetical protein
LRRYVRTFSPGPSRLTWRSLEPRFRGVVHRHDAQSLMAALPPYRNDSGHAVRSRGLCPCVIPELAARCLGAGCIAPKVAVENRQRLSFGASCRCCGCVAAWTGGGVGGRAPLSSRVKATLGPFAASAPKIRGGMEGERATKNGAPTTRLGKQQWLSRSRRIDPKGAWNCLDELMVGARCLPVHWGCCGRFALSLPLPRVGPVRRLLAQER